MCCGFSKGSEDATQRGYIGTNQEGSVFIGMQMGAKEMKAQTDNTQKVKVELLNQQIKL